MRNVIFGSHSLSFRAGLQLFLRGLSGVELDGMDGIIEAVALASVSRLK